MDEVRRRNAAQHDQSEDGVGYGFGADEKQCDEQEDGVDRPTKQENFSQVSFRKGRRGRGIGSGKGQGYEQRGEYELEGGVWPTPKPSTRARCVCVCGGGGGGGANSFV